MKRFLFALATLAALCSPASAVTCNNASGFVKLFGTIPSGDILVLGTDCQTAVDGGLFGNSMSQFTTVAALKASVAPNIVVADVEGFNTPGDGGGGLFYFDPVSAVADDGCTIFAPGSGGGRWFRIYSGAVNVDWCGANNGVADAQAAFAAAALFSDVFVPKRSYLMNGSISILNGQHWKFNGSTLTHTDNTKVYFKAIATNAVPVDNWTFEGPVTLTGTCVSACGSPEKGLYAEATRRFRVTDLTATLFQGPAIHVNPGTRTITPFLGATGQWSNIHVDQSVIGLQADAGTNGEYQTFSNLNSTGNITGVQIAAGNYIIDGGNITDNTNGLSLLGGSNNGHGVVSAVNINHNSSFNIIADAVTLGFTLNGIHVYADSLTTGKIWFKNAAVGIWISNSIIDAPIVADSTGINGISNSWTNSGTFYNISGTNPGQLALSGNNFPGDVRTSAQFNVASSTVLADIPGLVFPVTAGSTYGFTATLYTTSNVAGGVKMAMNGTATATAINYAARTFDPTGFVGYARVAALGTAAGAVTAVTNAVMDITGTITVNAGGTLTVQFAQNASNGANSSVLVGSTLRVWNIQ
jgi:hypothetical protein